MNQWISKKEGHVCPGEELSGKMSVQKSDGKNYNVFLCL